MSSASTFCPASYQIGICVGRSLSGTYSETESVIYECDDASITVSNFTMHRDSFLQGVEMGRQLLARGNDTLTVVISSLYGEVDPKTATLVMGELDQLDQTYVPYGIVGTTNTITLKGTHLTVEGGLDDDQQEST